MRKISLLVFVLIAMLNCTNQTKPKVKGTIEPLGLESNKKVYVFELAQNTMIAIDSAEVGQDGSFNIELKEDIKGIYHFGSAPQNTLPIVVDNKTQEIELTIKNNQQFAMDYIVQGSEKANQMALFYKEVYGMMKLNQSLAMKMKQLAPDNTAGQAILRQESMMASQDFLEFRNKFIQDNKGSEALVVVLEQIRPEAEYELFKEVAEDLNKTLPNTPYTSNLNKYLDQLKAGAESAKAMEDLLQVGSPAPELEFANPEGEKVKLSSLRGKVVLIDFWASWCKPCRMENPNIVSMYNKYKDQGFDIYSVSLDDKKKNWVEAIAKDGLTWKSHVSDLKGWQSGSVLIYGFQGIPFTVLIDREGKILAKKLRGPQLETALKAAL